MSTQETNLQAIADAIREKDGTAEPIPASTFAERIRTLSTAGGEPAGVSSFNGRTGAVTPQAGDYTAEMVGAVPAGQGGVGRSMAGKTVKPTYDESVTAGYGSEIFNDYESRTFASVVGSDKHVATGGNVASGKYSHAEGDTTTASGSYSHAEGRGTVSSAESSHAEGYDTVASNSGAHAEGWMTIASGEAAHAEGTKTEAKGGLSHAGGAGTIANDFQYAIGTYNVERTGSRTGGSRFIVGNGTDSARSNAFRVETSGKCYGVGAWNSSGADYAELFEWADGNPEHEDRAGLFVTLEGERIRLAGPEDGYILGIVSASPSVVGDVYDDQWKGMHIRDVFGRIVYEMQDFPARTVERPGPDGKPETVELTPAHSEMAPKINPEYDNTVKYQPRTQRPEWDAVGLMGKLVAVDDGACQPDGWAAVGPGGKATVSAERTRYRVMARLDESHIRIMIL